jgi:hypothetical protein
MLVLDSPAGLLLVRQPDHAALSARLARAWRPPEFLSPRLWDLFIAATAHHDDGWAEAESLPALDPAGRPHDFKSLPIALHSQIWRRTIALAWQHGPYVTAIVAGHGRWLYENFAKEEPAADRETRLAFIAEATAAVEAEKRRLMAGCAEERAAAEDPALESARRLLAFLDAASLALLGGLPRFRRSESLAFAREEAPLSLTSVPDGTAITPWPFLEARVEGAVPATEVSGRAFASPEALRDALGRGRDTALRYALRPGRPADPAR